MGDRLARRFGKSVNIKTPSKTSDEISSSSRQLRKRGPKKFVNLFGKDENSGDEYEDASDELPDDLFKKKKAPVMNYFVGISSKKPMGSCSILEMESIDESTVSYLESDIDMRTTRAKNVALFGEVFLHLKEKFNVIIYGFGSKRKLLHSFSEKFLYDEHCLSINGYFPALTFSDVANQFKIVFKAGGVDHDSLVKAAEELDNDFFLVIHSIDVLLSSNSRIKQLIIDMVISSEGKLHLLASVDHVNSGLIFDSTARTKLDIVWMEMNTFVPYTVERGYTVSTETSTETRDLTLSSILHVYSSLTINAQKIFLQILDYCVDKHKKLEESKKKEKEFKAAKASKTKEKKQKRGRGKSRRFPVIEEESEEEMETDEEGEMMDFQPKQSSAKTKGHVKSVDDELLLSTLYKICREEYLVNSEITLKAQLTEFQDHNIMKLTKGSDGSPVIRLRIPISLAEAFLTKVRDS